MLVTCSSDTLWHQWRPHHQRNVWHPPAVEMTTQPDHIECGQYPGPRNVGPVSGVWYRAIVFTHSSIKVSQLFHCITSYRFILTYNWSLASSPSVHWLPFTHLIPCLTSQSQRDRPLSVNVFRHNLNEHLRLDTNLENYWIYIPNTFPESYIYSDVV